MDGAILVVSGAMVLCRKRKNIFYLRSKWVFLILLFF